MLSHMDGKQKRWEAGEEGKRKRERERERE